MRTKKHYAFSLIQFSIVFLNRAILQLSGPTEELLANAARKTMASNTHSCRFRGFVTPVLPTSRRTSCSRCFIGDTPVSMPTVMAKRV